MPDDKNKGTGTTPASNTQPTGQTPQRVAKVPKASLERAAAISWEPPWACSGISFHQAAEARTATPVAFKATPRVAKVVQPPAREPLPTLQTRMGET